MSSFKKLIKKMLKDDEITQEVYDTLFAEVNKLPKLCTRPVASRNGEACGSSVTGDGEYCNKCEGIKNRVSGKVSAKKSVTTKKTKVERRFLLIQILMMISQLQRSLQLRRPSQPIQIPMMNLQQRNQLRRRYKIHLMMSQLRRHLHLLRSLPRRKILQMMMLPRSRQRRCLPRRKIQATRNLSRSPSRRFPRRRNLMMNQQRDIRMMILMMNHRRRLRQRQSFLTAMTSKLMYNSILI